MIQEYIGIKLYSASAFKTMKNRCRTFEKICMNKNSRNTEKLRSRFFLLLTLKAGVKTCIERLKEAEK